MGCAGEAWFRLGDRYFYTKSKCDGRKKDFYRGHSSLCECLNNSPLIFEWSTSSIFTSVSGAAEEECFVFRIE